MGFNARQPRLVACVGRDDVHARFCIEHASRRAAYVAVWIDSEEPVNNLEAAWGHLEGVKTVGRWERPEAATDDQVLFMTTCMETWMVADQKTLQSHYGSNLHENALPPLEDLESRSREEVQRKLGHATRRCKNAYEKGKRSFTLFELLNPEALQKHLPRFVRVRRILNARL
jgi:hypothetical protein